MITKPGNGERLSKDTKWVIGVLLTCAAAFSTVEYTQTMQIGKVTEQAAAAAKALQQLTATVQSLTVTKVATLETRMSVMETKQILPAARIEIDRLTERVRKLEMGE